MRFLAIFIILCGFISAEVKTENSYKTDNIWLVSLQAYRSYMSSVSEFDMLQNRLKHDSNSIALKEEIDILKSNLKLYNYENRQPLYEIFQPFENVLKLIENANISHVSLLSNDIDKSVKELNGLMKNYENEYKKAFDIIDGFENEAKNQNTSKETVSAFQNDKRLLKISLDTLRKTFDSVIKQYDIYNKRVTDFKYKEIKKLSYILISIIFLFAVMTFVKLFLKKSLKKERSEENDRRLFLIKKIMNILFVIITILIFAFSYIDNMARALAVFGVIGAGLTVVMKEWVLSYVGWFVLITSNSIQLGDRIKISKDGRSIIGDVINISLTKITLYENITNDALTEHKKAGRVIFVPNYYLIMGEVYNYTHLSLKTILDLVEIYISFDSNIAKAEKIALESANAITEKFTEMAKKQYDALKKYYTLRNMTQYPKVFFYPSIYGNGIVMGVWYVSPYREILKHKSEVTKEIIARFKNEDDINLIYSANTVFLESGIEKTL
ncbi:MAG: mechanosensitive ion channel family protein [Campylobacteraceae bacterium]|jgi:small-conductance mechanosensitive channel|nr:mechanosensitive ion channel family protein [Campylobacteraceae bacterium]